MTETIKRRAELFFVVLWASAVTLLAVRSLAGATLAVMLSGLSAHAFAGTSKAAVQVHGAAMAGAFAGSLMLLLQLKGRPWPERLVLVVASFVAAYFGGVMSAELWEFGPGGVGVAGTICAYLAVPALDAVLAILKDLPWIKRMIEKRLTGAAQEVGDGQNQ